MGNVLLRMPTDLHTAASQEAREDGRSLNAWILRAILAALPKGAKAALPVGRSPRRKATP